MHKEMLEGEIEWKSEGVHVVVLEALTGGGGGEGRKKLNIM